MLDTCSLETDRVDALRALEPIDAPVGVLHRHALARKGLIARFREGIFALRRVVAVNHRANRRVKRQIGSGEVRVTPAWLLHHRRSFNHPAAARRAQLTAAHLPARTERVRRTGERLRVRPALHILRICRRTRGRPQAVERQRLVRLAPEDDPRRRSAARETHAARACHTAEGHVVVSGGLASVNHHRAVQLQDGVRKASAQIDLVQEAPRIEDTGEGRRVKRTVRRAEVKCRRRCGRIDDLDAPVAEERIEEDIVRIAIGKAERTIGAAEVEDRTRLRIALDLQLGALPERRGDVICARIGGRPAENGGVLDHHVVATPHEKFQVLLRGEAASLEIDRALGEVQLGFDRLRQRKLIGLDCRGGQVQRTCADLGQPGILLHVHRTRQLERRLRPDEVDDARAHADRVQGQRTVIAALQRQLRVIRHLERARLRRPALGRRELDLAAQDHELARCPHPAREDDLAGPRLDDMKGPA